MTGRIMNLRFCLAFGAAVSVASLLMAQRGESMTAPAPVGEVYVYFPSLCATPGDPSDCHETTLGVRPSFPDARACWDYADRELACIAGRRVMQSCMTVREA